MDLRAQRGSAGAPAEERSSASPSDDLSLEDVFMLQEFVEKIEEGVYIASADGSILDANPAFLRLFGADDIDQIKELPLHELWVEPGSRRDLYHMVESRGSASNLEFQIRRLDGKTLWVSDSVYALRDDAGQIVAYQGILVDITARKVAEQALRRSEEKYRAIFENVMDIFYQTDLEGRITECSPAIERYLGYSREELIGEELAILFVDGDAEAELRAELEAEEEVTDEEILLADKNGDQLWFSVNARAIHEEDEVPTGFEGMLRDITERKELQRRLEELSVRDALTGCYNRRYLEKMRSELERPTARWGCLVIDLDGFKAVNDTYGHEEGDRVLQGVAHFLQRHGRAEDVFVRLGGDEFALIVQAASEDELEGIARRLLEVAPYQSPAAFSLGYAYRQPGESIEDVIAAADREMYAAKGKGLQPPTSR